MKDCNQAPLMDHLREADNVWLFLDYDGTLADFAETPDEIIADQELLGLIRRLTANPHIRVTIISGRRLAHIQDLIPLTGMIKAGSYGLELETAEGDVLYQFQLDELRPFLDGLKKQWRDLLDGREGFYLEDKGWTLAIHAKDAQEGEAQGVLDLATSQAEAHLQLDDQGIFRLQGGHRFLECSPAAGDKKRTVEHILQTYPWKEDALLLYLGDDDKDAVAFEAIQAAGGMVIAVGARLLDSSADCRLASPTAVRQWLEGVVQNFNSQESIS